MDWRLVATTFATVFLAELGDKTQLATLTFATSTPGSKWGVFIGSAAALVLCSALAVVGGELIARVVSPTVLKRLAGVAFVVIGIWVLWGTRVAAS
jgi:putative Ca2+/H+ antiporter (TMEM165/GDT1 family)